MAKRTIDITDRLSFDERPVIVIKKKKIEVNDDAIAMLKLMAMVQDDGAAEDPSIIADMAGILFDEKAMATIADLHLNVKDFTELVNAAMDLIGNDEEEEAP